MKKEMRLLENTAQKFWEANTFCGSDILVLHINHFMENSFAFNDCLSRIFSRIVFVGVPYQPRISGKLEDYPRNYPCYYGWGENGRYSLVLDDKGVRAMQGDIHEACKSLIEEALKYEILPYLDSGKRLLIIEDGGYFCQCRELWDREIPGLGHRLKHHIIGSVEQTTSGTKRCMEYFNKQGYAYPCTSVARSDLKMDVESVWIGNRIVEEVNGLLYEADTFLDFHEVLLLGYGVVGRAVANVLRGRQCEVTVYDPSSQIQSTARADKKRVIQSTREYDFRSDTIVIGTAGSSSFPASMLEQFILGQAKKLYLASGSSREIEFWELKILLKEGGLLKYKVWQETPKNECYEKYIVSGKGCEKEIYILAGGIPVNFFKEDARSLTFSAIDLIFTEMFLCGCWMCNEKHTNRMYLLGEDCELTKHLKEDELYERWCLVYGLAVIKPEAHPGKEYLRKKGMVR